MFETPYCFGIAGSFQNQSDCHAILMNPMSAANVFKSGLDRQFDAD